MAVRREILPDGVLLLRLRMPPVEHGIKRDRGESLTSRGGGVGGGGGGPHAVFEGVIDSLSAYRHLV